jgi:hypothetical protein
MQPSEGIVLLGQGCLHKFICKPEAARGDDEKGEKALDEKERGEVLPDISVESCACTCP